MFDRGRDESGNNSTPFGLSQRIVAAFSRVRPRRRPYGLARFGFSWIELAAEPILRLPAQEGDQNSVPCPSEPSRGRARLGLAGAASGAARFDAPDGAGARPSATAATTPSENSILSGSAALISAARRSGRFDSSRTSANPRSSTPW